MARREMLSPLNAACLALSLIATVAILAPRPALAQRRPSIAPSPVSPSVVAPTVPSGTVQPLVVSQPLPTVYLSNGIYLTPTSTYSSANYRGGEPLSFQFLQDTYVYARNLNPDSNYKGTRVLCKIPANTAVWLKVQYSRRRGLFHQGNLVIGLPPDMTISINATTVPPPSPPNTPAEPIVVTLTVAVDPTSKVRPSKGTDPSTIAVGTSDKMYPWLTVGGAALSAGSAFVTNSGWKTNAYWDAGMSVVGTTIAATGGILGNDATVNAGNVYQIDVSDATGTLPPPLPPAAQ